jgi:hypothetical protein
MDCFQNHTVQASRDVKRCDGLGNEHYLLYNLEAKARKSHQHQQTTISVFSKILKLLNPLRAHLSCSISDAV